MKYKKGNRVYFELQYNSDGGIYMSGFGTVKDINLPYLLLVDVQANKYLTFKPHQIRVHIEYILRKTSGGYDEI